MALSPSVISAQALDAYKTYLYHQAKPQVANKPDALGPGMKIPLDDLKNHIKTVENLIVKYKKYGLPSKEEENKLKGLNKLLSELEKVDLVKLAEQEIEAKEIAKAAEEAKKVAEKQAKWGQYNKKVLTTHVKKIEHPKGAPGVLGYYKKATISNIKANTILTGIAVPVSSKSEIEPLSNSAPAPGVKLGSISLSQRIVMQMGILSNCNVTVHSLRTGGTRWAPVVTLRCESCKSEHEIEDTLSLTDMELTGIPKEIESFCKLHRHEPDIAAPVGDAGGRKFREDE